MPFTIARKGYDTKEIDAYLAKLTKEHRDELEKQQATISLLKERLTLLDGKVKDYESQKKLIAASLLRATEKAEEIERSAGQRVEEEAAFWRSFHLRWTAYFRKLVQTYPLDGELEQAKRFTEEIGRIFSNADLDDRAALDQFLALEDRRLAQAENRADERETKERKEEVRDEIEQILNDLSL